MVPYILFTGALIGGSLRLRWSWFASIPSISASIPRAVEEGFVSWRCRLILGAKRPHKHVPRLIRGIPEIMVCRILMFRWSFGGGSRYCPELPKALHEGIYLKPNRIPCMIEGMFLNQELLTALGVCRQVSYCCWRESYMT